MKQKLRRPRNQKRGPEGPFRFFPPETTPVLFRCEYPKSRRTIIFTDMLEVSVVFELSDIFNFLLAIPSLKNCMS